MNKTIVSILIVLSLVAIYLDLPAAGSWDTYVSRDNSFTFTYPAGWQVVENDSSIEITEPGAGRKLIILAVSDASGKSAGAMAKELGRMLKKDYPDLALGATNSSGSNSVYLTISHTQDGTARAGDAFVITDNDQAVWFSHSGPAKGYDRQTAVSTLTTLIKSLKGTGNEPSPASESESSQLTKNAHAFMFVLEFALGAPLPQQDEQDIEKRLLDGWRGKSSEELKKFDAYPNLVKMILAANQQRLEELRSTLEQTIRQWLEESIASDPSVSAIQKHLDNQTRPLASGPPPLTYMAATAYSELMVFSAQLNKNGTVSAAAIKKNLVAAWSRFSTEERQAVLTAPGIWITARTILRYGTAKEQQTLKRQLAKLTPPVQSQSASSSASETKKPMSMVSHNVMMEVNRMTFNTYMWSRGFRKTTFGY